jgi:hypothetical protein
MNNEEDRLIPWSISMLHVYETCPLYFKNKYILRIPEPERPLPKGKTEHANDRGGRIHTACEDYVKGERIEFPEEAEDFEEDIEDLRNLYDQGLVMLEHDWCFDSEWIPCARKERDSIFIVDVAAWIVPNEWLLIIDYKTGSPYPVKHMDQMQGYALGAYKKFPDLKQVTTELWYLDKNDISTSTFKPQAARAIQNTLEKRVARMRADTEFKPASHQYACRFCPYKNDCEFFESGVKKKARPPSSINAWNTGWKI